MGKVAKSGEKLKKLGKVEKCWKKWRNFFTKWLAAAILNDRKSLSIAFLAISDQYGTFYLFSKWPPEAILDPDFCQN